LTELHSRLPFQKYTDDFGQQSRPTCYFGDNTSCIFTYVGLCLQPLEWPTSLLKLRQHVVDTCQLSRSGSPLTACLVNLYPFGEGHIPWHCDDIRAHGRDKIVASLSLSGPFEGFNYDDEVMLMVVTISNRNCQCQSLPFTHDYGPWWQEAWDEYVKEWKASKEAKPHPSKAEDMKAIHKNKPLETVGTVNANPHPETVKTACFLETKERPLMTHQ
jgi:hypothetical protein